MVSSDNILLAGLGAVALFFVLRGSSGGSSLTTPPAPAQEVVNPQIQILKDAIKGVQGFISTTFKAPIIPKGLCCDRFGKQLPCRGPNCLGIFQAKGTISSFDPFTGQRVALGGSTQFQNITGSNFALNQARITQGGQLFTEASNILKNLKGELSILEAKSV